MGRTGDCMMLYSQHFQFLYRCSTMLILDQSLFWNICSLTHRIVTKMCSWYIHVLWCVDYLLQNIVVRLVILPNAALTKTMPSIILIGFAFYNNCSCYYITIFERGSSSMTIQVSMATFVMESELRCALTCSRDAMCDMFTYNESFQTCSQFHVQWPASVVTFEINGSLPLKGTRNHSKVNPWHTTLWKYINNSWTKGMSLEICVLVC